MMGGPRHADARGQSLFGVKLCMCCEVELDPEQRRLLFGATLLPLNPNHAHGRSTEHGGNVQTGHILGACVAVPASLEHNTTFFSGRAMAEPSHTWRRGRAFSFWFVFLKTSPLGKHLDWGGGGSGWILDYVGTGTRVHIWTPRYGRDLCCEGNVNGYLHWSVPWYLHWSVP